MKIDGRAIAGAILEGLTKDVSKLKSHGITPTLAVILVGDNPSSLSYIRQKQKAVDRIGATMLFRHVSEKTTAGELKHIIEAYNGDPSVHGIIVQQPLPPHIRAETILELIHPAKDVDGFVQGTKFEVPVAEAVLKILAEIFRVEKNSGEFLAWLQHQTITVIGRGETAGKPIAKLLTQLHCTTSIIHSKTVHPEHILQTSTIIISCVGKPHVIGKKNLPPGVILISVGLSREAEKLTGDYDEEEIENIASFYTPTPGGVGPVNVACLMQNVVKACIMQ